jgi:hypothetical protein
MIGVVPRRSPLVIALAFLAALGASSATGQPGLTMIYTQRPAAAAIYDGAPNVAGIRDALRQAPIFDDRRWPASRQVAKVSGAELSGLGARRIEAQLRAGIREYGGMVAMDEMAAREWSPEASANLAEALDRLGPLASRVIIYVSADLVSQIGRYSPDKTLAAHQQAALPALQRTGAVMLEMYRGGAAPMSRQEFADYPTRWLARWAGADPGKLHLVIGPDQGQGQATVWAWARGTAAGRQIMKNGVGAYGLKTRDEGLDWLTQNRAFQAQPDVNPGGPDTTVATVGALSVQRLGKWRVNLSFTRLGRAVMVLRPVTGRGRPRVIAKLEGPGARVVDVPRDLHSGKYRIVTVALGSGVREVSNVGPLVVP